MHRLPSTRHAKPTILKLDASSMSLDVCLQRDDTAANGVAGAGARDVAGRQAERRRQPVDRRQGACGRRRQRRRRRQRPCRHRPPQPRPVSGLQAHLPGVHIEHGRCFVSSCTVIPAPPTGQSRQPRAHSSCSGRSQTRGVSAVQPWCRASATTELMVFGNCPCAALLSPRLLLTADRFTRAGPSRRRQGRGPGGHQR